MKVEASPMEKAKGKALQAERIMGEFTLIRKLSVIREHKGSMVAGEGEKGEEQRIGVEVGDVYSTRSCGDLVKDLDFFPNASDRHHSDKI